MPHSFKSPSSSQADPSTQTTPPPELDQEHDGPWKSALEYYFQEAMALLFPTIYEAIDWQRKPQFLDKELQKILAQSDNGRTYADKLVKVRLLSGEMRWLLIHIEVQGERDRLFAERMFRYNSRINDRYNQKVISLAILADISPSFRPKQYDDEAFGCQIRFTYPVVKLLDFLPRREELMKSDNVFGLIVLAQMDAKMLKGKPKQRLRSKVALVRELYERGYTKKQLLTLFNLIDWMITLPKEFMVEFEHHIDDIEKEKQVQYINSIERLHMERAEEKGKIELALQMIRDFNLPIKEVAERYKLSLQELMARLNQGDNPTSQTRTS